jgi:hypothetical protein
MHAGQVRAGRPHDSRRDGSAPVFEGLRIDKDTRECVFEKPREAA